MKRLADSLPALQTMRERTAVHSVTGTPPFETGSAKPKTTGPNGEDLSTAADETVEASLRQVLGSRLVERTEGFTSDYGYDFRFAGYELSGPTSSEEIADVRAIVDCACRPLDRADLARELTKLRLVCVSKLADEDFEGWMTVIIEEVEEFPAAVVIGACKRWRRREKFLPTCAEIREECHQLNRRRHSLRRLVGADGER